MRAALGVIAAALVFASAQAIRPGKNLESVVIDRLESAIAPADPCATISPLRRRDGSRQPPWSPRATEGGPWRCRDTKVPLIP